jgi:hypothetical protein
MTLTIRPRRDWENPSQRVVGPAMVLRSITLLPAHYTAAATIPADTAAYLRAIQNDYTVNRGYSIGYNFAVDRTGACWELRGFDIKCAANKGMNDVTIAVLCLVDGAQAMNPAMVNTFRQLGAEAVRRTRPDLLVVGHRDIGATACPGNGIYAQVVSGQLEPAVTPTPKPPDPTPDPTPPDPTEDYDMAFIIQNRGTGEIALIYGDRQMVGLAGPDLTGYQAQFGAMIPTDPVVWASFLGKSQ